MADIRIEAGFYDWRQSVDAGGNARSAQRPYFVFNAADEEAALAAVQALLSAPEAKVSGLYLARVDIEERINVDTWKVSATYERNEAKAREESTAKDDPDGTAYGNEDPAITFDTTGGQRHINKSLSTVGRYPATATDYGGAIEVDGAGNVAGIDIAMPAMTFSESHYFKPAKITPEFKKQLFSLTGTVNNAAFKGFAAGEVLFLGVSGRRTGSGDAALWELTYTFSVSQNQKNITVGGGITVPQKYGWDYLWTQFGEVVKNGAIIKQPIGAYVERVYKTTDFTKLGINVKASAQ